MNWFQYYNTVRIITVGHQPFSVQNIAMAIHTSVHVDKTANRLRNFQYVHIRSIVDRIVLLIVCVICGEPDLCIVMY